NVTDVNRNANVNRNFNDVNVNRNVDVNAGYDRWGHPVAWGTAAGVTAGATAAAVTHAAVGSTVAVLPTGWSPAVVGEITYSQCGSTWYEPYYLGTTVQYQVVNPPR